MEELLLLPGLRVVQRAVAGEGAEPAIHEVDVTAHAVEFLFEPVRLDARATLADVLGLLDASPSLLTVFRREFADEIMVEVRKGALDAEPGLDPPEVVGIDWLELYWSWTLDSVVRHFRADTSAAAARHWQGAGGRRAELRRDGR